MPVRVKFNTYSLSAMYFIKMNSVSNMYFCIQLHGPVLDKSIKAEGYKFLQAVSEFMTFDFLGFFF